MSLKHTINKRLIYYVRIFIAKPFLFLSLSLTYLGVLAGTMKIES